MPGPASRYLSLPEEFVLLSHWGSGRVHDSAQTAFGCAAAELGELALRRKLLVRPHKSRKFGFEVYRHKGEIHLLETDRADRTGLAWADELLAGLETRSAHEPRPITVQRWLRQRHREAFALHREALTGRGVLRRERGRFLGKDRYYPDPAVRNALINEVSAAHTGRIPLDEHLLFLCDLLEAAELTKDFGLRLTRRQRLDRGRGIGSAGSLPEALRDTSTVLAFSLPKREGSDFGLDLGD